MSTSHGHGLTGIYRRQASSITNTIPQTVSSVFLSSLRHGSSPKL
jgi:hypothetical protein